MAMKDRTSLDNGRSPSRGSRTTGMNPRKVSLQIVFLDGNPADRALLGLQFYPLLGFELTEKLSIIDT